MGVVGEADQLDVGTKEYRMYVEAFNQLSSLLDNPEILKDPLKRQQALETAMEPIKRKSATDWILRSLGISLMSPLRTGPGTVHRLLGDEPSITRAVVMSPFRWHYQTVMEIYKAKKAESEK